MKRFTQCVCLTLVMAAILAVPAYAVDSFNQRGSDYFAKFSVYIDEVSSTEFEVWFDVTAVGTMDKLGVSKIVVERSSDMSYWTPVKTYNMSDYSQMTDTSTAKHADCVTYSSCLSGYYYRAVVTLYAKKGSSYGEYDVTTPVYAS